MNGYNGYRKNIGAGAGAGGSCFQERLCAYLRPYLVWNTLWILLFCVGLGYFLIAMPKGLDDYWYSVYLRPWLESHGQLFPEEGVNIFRTGVPWNEIIETWRYHISTDNARLGNMLVVFFLLLPKWVGSGLALFAWVYVMRGSFRLAGIDWRKSAWVPVMLFLWTFFMPWRNGMSSMVYQFNYIFPSALVVLLMELLFKRGNSRCLSAFIVAFLIGWWHEGFGVPLAIALMVQILVDKKCRRARFYSAIAGVCAALVLLLAIPSSIHRAGELASGKGKEFVGLMYDVAINVLYVVFVGLWLILGRRHRKIEGTGLVMFLLILGLVPILIMFRTYSDTRVTWLSQMVSIIGGVLMVHNYLPENCGNRWMVLLKPVITLVAVVLFTSHLAVADYYVAIIRKDLLTAETEYSKGIKGAYFGRVVTCAEFPLIALNMPDVMAYTTTVHMVNTYRDMQGEPFRIIPEELEYITSETGRKLAGEDGYREYMGRIFKEVPADEWHITMPEVEADYGSGYKKCRSFSYPFVSKTDGRKYVWIYVCANWYEQHFSEITGLRVKER